MAGRWAVPFKYPTFFLGGGVDGVLQNSTPKTYFGSLKGVKSYLLKTDPSEVIKSDPSESLIYVFRVFFQSVGNGAGSLAIGKIAQFWYDLGKVERVQTW